MASEEVVSYQLQDYFGYQAVKKVNTIGDFIISQAEYYPDYASRISFVGDIMNKLEKKWCYLDQVSINGNPYLVGKKLTYQLLWLKLDAYLRRLNIQKFQSWLGVKD